MMSSSFYPQGIKLSLGLHLSILVAFVAWMWVQPFMRPHETVFEVIQIPLGTPDAPMTATPAPPAFNLPEAPPVQPVSPPRAQPQPPPPRVQPAPPVQRTPPPAVPRQSVAPPAPKPKPATPQQQQLTYEEYIKQHGQPKTRPPREARPASPRPAPRIDTRFNVDLTDAIRSAGSLSGSSEAARTAVNIYVAGLNDLLKRAWNNPQLELTTVVEFDVAPSGRLSNIRVVKRSGNAAFDESVLAAFREVTSGGPTPEGRSLQLRFKFNGIAP